MASAEECKVLELPQDWRILRGQQYRRPLYYAAQAALWIGYVYLAVRFLSSLFAPSWTLQFWLMFWVETEFFRKSQFDRCYLCAHPTNSMARTIS